MYLLEALLLDSARNGFFAFSMAASRVLPCSVALNALHNGVFDPAILASRLPLCVVAFVDSATAIEHGPAPSPGRGVGTGAVPGRTMMRSPLTKRSDE